MALRILLVDDHELFREGLSRVLAAEPGFEIAGRAGTIAEGLAVLASGAVDVVLLDHELEAAGAPDFILGAAERGFAGRILVLTAQVSGRDASLLLRQGVAGIFLKRHSAARLIETIRAVAAGEMWTDPGILQALAEWQGSGEPHRLTAREEHVLRGVFEGLANKQIAGNLLVSESAVKATLQRLFNKTGTRTRAQLVRAAMERAGDAGLS